MSVFFMRVRQAASPNASARWVLPVEVYKDADALKAFINEGDSWQTF